MKVELMVAEQPRCKIKDVDGVHAVWGIDWLNCRYYVLLDGKYTWFEAPKVTLIEEELNVF